MYIGTNYEQLFSRLMSSDMLILESIIIHWLSFIGKADASLELDTYGEEFFNWLEDNEADHDTMRQNGQVIADLQ
jgi:hypothetical protein